LHDLELEIDRLIVLTHHKLISEAERSFTVRGHTVKEGEWITIDGTTGDVMLGQLPLIEPELSGDFVLLVKWADAYRKIGVRTNADTPTDAAASMDFGAEGIGLCRTEHMFFAEDRIIAMREMIVAEETEGRRKALAKLLAIQRNDFKAIFEKIPWRREQLPTPVFLPGEFHGLD